MMPEIVRTPWNPDEKSEEEKEEEKEIQTAQQFWVRHPKKSDNQDEMLGNDW